MRISCAPAPRVSVKNFNENWQLNFWSGQPFLAVHVDFGRFARELTSFPMHQESAVTKGMAIAVCPILQAGLIYQKNGYKAGTI